MEVYTDNSKVIAELQRQNDELVARVAHLFKLCDAANCPQCGDKSGAYYDHNEEVCQCQWCDELNKLRQQSTNDGSDEK